MRSDASQSLVTTSVWPLLTHSLAPPSLVSQLRQPIIPGEGPTGLCLAPSRELARQTFEVLEVSERNTASEPL